MISLLHELTNPNQVRLKNGVTVKAGDRLVAGKEVYPHIEVVRVHTEDRLVELYSHYTTGTYLVAWEAFVKFDYRKIDD